VNTTSVAGKGVSDVSLSARMNDWENAAQQHFGQAHRAHGQHQQLRVFKICHINAQSGVATLRRQATLARDERKEFSFSLFGKL
jgi:hypothetical protein